MAAHILLFGRDPILLQTRLWILEKRFAVETAGDIQSLATRLAERHFDLIVLCHSLSSRDCDAAKELLRTTSSGTKVLSISNSWTHTGCELGNQICVRLDGPHLLMKRAVELVAAAK